MSGRVKSAVLLTAAIAVMLASVFAVAGCGDDDEESTDQKNGVSGAILLDGERSAERSALASARKAEDRYLPGPLEMRASCSPPTPAPQPDTPFQLRCLVEGYGTPPGGDALSYMTNEEWLVPVDAEGKVGEATLLGQARIRAYRRKDDSLNCTNHEARAEKCAPPLPGQTAATPPPTVPQGENAPQPAPLVP
jgi:hypothetical protein